MEVCSSYRCARTQHKWSAALFRAKCNNHCSVLPCKTGSQQAVFHCSYTYANLLFIQVCSDATPMHCSSVQGRMQSPLFNAALQNRLTAGSVSLQLHLLNSLLFIQVCSDATPMHCSSVQGRMKSPLFNAALQNRLTAGSVSLQLHLLNSLLFTIWCRVETFCCLSQSGLGVLLKAYNCCGSLYKFCCTIDQPIKRALHCTRRGCTSLAYSQLLPYEESPITLSHSW